MLELVLLLQVVQVPARQLPLALQLHRHVGHTAGNRLRAGGVRLHRTNSVGQFLAQP